MTERELLKEAHELMCAILFSAAIQSDIAPMGSLGKRITAFNAALREMKIVGEE